MISAPCPIDEPRRIQRLHSLAILDTAADPILDSLTSLAARATARPSAVISLLDAERQWFKSATGAEQGGESSRATSFCGHAIAQDEAIMEVEDALTDPRFQGNPAVVGAPHVRHYAGAPLLMPGGERIGTLCVFGPQAGRLTLKQRDLLKELAQTVVGVILAREREHHQIHARELGEADILTELAPIGLFSTSRTGAVLSANRRWQSLLGIDVATDAMGWGWLASIHADDRERLRVGWQEAVASARHFEVTCRTAGADTRSLKFQLVPADTAGRPYAACGIASDVTETWRLEEALKQRNALLETVIDNLPEGLLVLDEHRNVLVSNRRLQQLCQLPDDAVAPGRAFDGILAHLAQQEARSGGQVRNAKTLLEELCWTQDASRDQTRPDGAVLHIRSKVTPFGWNVRTYADVTSERQVQQELRDSEQRLVQAIRATGLTLWEYEADRVRLFTVESIGEQSDDVLRGHSPVPLENLLTDPSQLRDFRQSLDELLSGTRVQLSQSHTMDRGDQHLWLQTEARVGRRDAHGRPCTVVGTSRNITRRRLAEAQLREAVACAQKANRAKADFLSTMSHEIRTPLNGIAGLTRMLLDADLPPKESRYVTLIESCARTLLGLVDNVLDLSKIEAGRMTATPEETELPALLVEICDVFEIGAAAKGLQLKLCIDAHVPPRVLVDPQRLRQILMNLLGNAVKFTETGGVTVALGALSIDGHERLRFEVRDTGIGIGESEIDALFQRFSQLGPAKVGKYRGTGLGLAIARELARMMNGELTATSTVGVGSTFTVDLPCIPCAEGAHPCVPTVDPAPPRQFDAPILLVDDDEVNRMVGDGLLRKLGYANLTAAKDGREALDMVRRHDYGLILMDCRMPGMDGFEATRQLRSEGCVVPIVALTAGAGVHDRTDCLLAGMDDYLPKPIDLDNLARMVDRWLGRHSCTQSHASLQQNE